MAGALLAVLPTGCSDDGSSPKLYGTVEDQQTLTLDEKGGTFTLGRNGARATIEVPPGALPSTRRVTLSLVSGVTTRGRVPVNATAVNIEPADVAFQIPVRMMQRVPAPGARRRLAAAQVPPGGDTLIQRWGARRVLVAVPNAEEDWEIDIDGAGLWAITEWQDPADAGADAPAGYVVEDEATVQLASTAKTVVLGTGTIQTDVTIPAQPMTSHGPLALALVSGVGGEGPAPTNGTAVRVGARPQPIGVPLRAQQALPPLPPPSTTPALLGGSGRPVVAATTWGYWIVTKPDGNGPWTVLGPARKTGNQGGNELWEFDLPLPGFLYGIARIGEGSDPDPVPDAGMPVDASTPMPDAAVPPPPTYAVMPNMIAFGTVGVGASSQATNVSIAVLGQSGATSAAITATLTGEHAADFVVADPSACLGKLLPAASTCTITTTFQPSSAGAKAAVLRLAAAGLDLGALPLTGVGSTAAALTAAPNPAGFGSVVVGSSSAGVAVTVTNGGTQPSGNVTAAISGPDATSFRIATAGCDGPLPGAGSCPFTLEFEPTSTGAKSATLTIMATPGGSTTVALTGTGQAPGEIRVAPGTKAFGQVLIGSTSAATVITVTNPGDVPTGTPSVSLTGPALAEFVIADNGCTAAVAPGASCTVSVAFKPTSSGSKTASLVVTAAPGGNATVDLSGTGVTQAALAASPLNLPLGAAEVGQKGMTATLTVQNTGGLPSGVLTTSIGGSHPGDVEVVTDGCVGKVLDPNGSCAIELRLAPTAVGSRSASVTIAGTPGGGATTMLTGLGTAPAQLSITPITGSFTDTVVGQSTDLPFSVKNVGEGVSGVPAVNVTGTDATAFSISANQCAAALVPGASCIVTVRFAPPTTGSKSATLAATASPGGNTSASLSGKGLAPAALVLAAPSGADLGTIPIGGQAQRVFTVSNTGDVPSGMPMPTLAGPQATQFMVIGNTCGASVAPAATCELTVRVAPAATGALSTTLGLAGSGSTIVVSATGILPASFDVQPTMGAFGTLLAGATKDLVFTVKNVGQAPSGVPSLSVDSTGSVGGTFGLVPQSNTCTTALDPGGTCAITVQLTSTGPGAKTGTFTVTGTPGGSKTAGLTGNTTGAQLQTPTSASGSIPVFIGGWIEYDVLVQNVGGSPTGPITPAVTGVDQADYQIQPVTGTLACPAAGLAPQSSCYVRLRFAPMAPGSKSATLTVTAAPGGNSTTALSDVAAAPSVLAITPVNHDFGGTGVTTYSAAQSFVVRNDGSTATATLGVTFEGVNATDFVLAGNGCSGNLGPSQTCTVVVQFRPLAAGTRYGSLRVSDGTTSAVAAMSGQGLNVPLLTLTPVTTNDAGDVGLGDSSVRWFTLRNVGDLPTGPVTTKLTVGDLEHFHLGFECDDKPLGPNQTCDFSVRFTPTKDGFWKADFEASASPGGVAVETITGTGVLGGATIDWRSTDGTPLPSLDFTPARQTIPAGEVARVTVLLFNAGDKPTGEPGVTVEGTDGYPSEDFGIVATNCSEYKTGLAPGEGGRVTPGSYCTVELEFHPRTDGPKAAQLRGVASPGGTKILPLFGNGLIIVGKDL